MSRLLRIATRIYALLMLLVLAVAATGSSYELPVVLTGVPVLWTCARLAQEGRLAALVLGAVAVPLWWFFAMTWFPCSGCGMRSAFVLVVELGIVPLAAVALGAAALGLGVARMATAAPRVTAWMSWVLGAAAGVGVGLRLFPALGPVGLTWLAMIGVFRWVLRMEPR